MNPLVPYYVTLMMKALATGLANVRSFIGVSSFVGLEIKFFEEGLAAVRALVIALFQMVPLNVLLKINEINKCNLQCCNIRRKYLR